jgi:hypothetical protein
VNHASFHLFVGTSDAFSLLDGMTPITQTIQPFYCGAHTTSLILFAFRTPLLVGNNVSTHNGCEPMLFNTDLLVCVGSTQTITNTAMRTQKTIRLYGSTDWNRLSHLIKGLSAFDGRKLSVLNYNGRFASQDLA